MLIGQGLVVGHRDGQVVNRTSLEATLHLPYNKGRRFSSAFSVHAFVAPGPQRGRLILDLVDRDDDGLPIDGCTGVALYASGDPILNSS